jgi:DNA-binding protein H-NS
MSDATLSTLMARAEDANAALAAYRVTQRTTLAASIQKQMTDGGLTMADLTRAKPSRTTGAVAAKYKDDTGNTWTGRGFKPKWLQAAIATGKTLESFAIAAPTPTTPTTQAS